MIALIGNSLYDLTPRLDIAGEFSVQHTDNDTIEAYFGPNRVDFGVSFYSHSKWAHIDRITGKITRDSAKPAHFRAVFHDFALDITA